MIAFELCRAFVRRGIAVGPFKLGAESIDARFYRTAADRPAHNFDVGLDGDAAVRSAVETSAADRSASSAAIALRSCIAGFRRGRRRSNDS